MLIIGSASFKLTSMVISEHWAGFLSGIFTTILSFLLLRYLHEHVFPQKELSISRKIIILFPLLLNGLRIIRVAYLQDKTRARKYGKSNIELRANRPLGVGFVVGFLASLFV